MLPADPFEERQALFHGVQPRGVGLQAVQPVLEAARHLGQADAQLFELGPPARGLRLPHLDLGELGLAFGEPLHGRALFVEEEGEGRPQRLGDGLGVPKHVALGLQVRLLAGPQLRGVDLAGLEAEVVDPLAARPVVPRQVLQPLGQTAVGVVRLGHAGEEGLGLRAAAPVEHGALEVRLDQAQLVPLAVDAEEIGGEVREQAQRRGLVVHEDAVPAAPGDLPADEHLPALGFEPRLVEHLPPAIPLRLEHAGDGESLRPGPHHLRARPRPGEERQRVDDDRLARARLTGQDVQPLSEFDRRFGQHGQVADVDLSEHRGQRLVME
jgi:hypothetical protein